jgi:predicted enzyme related to lactoylglutathione lyase
MAVRRAGHERLRLPHGADQRHLRRRAHAERGHPNYYFDTNDIEASIAKVRELGGEAGDKQPVPTHGWFSACKDSEGNTFFLWQGDASAA